MKSQRQLQLEEFLSENPNDPFIHYGIALEMLKSGENESGSSKLLWLITHHPDYLASYYQLGKFYEQQGEISKAIPVYKNGMAIAQIQKNKNTFNELKSALQELEEE